MIFLVIIVALMAIGILLCIKNRDLTEGAVASFVFAIIFIIVMGIIVVVNVSTIAQAEAFYKANASNYNTSVDSMIDILSEPSGQSFRLVDGSIEKLQHSNNVTAFMKNRLDRFASYNNTIASFRLWRSNFWVGPLLIPQVPDELQYIRIK